MGFSIRDEQHPFKILGSQSGQGITEYILILVVTVAMVLGGMYQLNNAFKTWAQNYFGNYLACLLETGELPTISGSPGDSGICAEQFEAFNFGEGWKPKPNGVSDGTSESSGPSRATAESGRVASGYFPSSGRFSGGRSGGSDSSGRVVSRFGASETPANTGSTAVSNYGNGYSALNRRLNTQVKYRLDNNSVMRDDPEAPQKSKVISTKRSDETTSKAGSARMKLKAAGLKRDTTNSDEGGLDFGDLIRILIIVAIILALILFLGGQALQVSKSME